MCRATADYADDPDHEADQEFLNGFFLPLRDRVEFTIFVDKSRSL